MSIYVQSGTRQKTGLTFEHPPSQKLDRDYTQDLGLSKNVTASITFVASPTAQLQAANGTFAAFAAGDLILVENTGLNNGVFNVTGIDAVNHSFLTVDNPPQNEGPVTAQVRSL